MIALKGFPAYAAGNADFITKRTELDEHDRVLVTDINADELPNGTLCLHSSTVAMMVTTLGWKLHTDADELALTEARMALDEANERLAAHQSLLEAIELALSLENA
jgi:hypothetical protein